MSDVDQPTLDGLGAPVRPASEDVAADLALLDAVTADLDSVEAVFARIDEGSDGSCEVCGSGIEPAALADHPLTRRCRLHT